MQLIYVILILFNLLLSLYISSNIFSYITLSQFFLFLNGIGSIFIENVNSFISFYPVILIIVSGLILNIGFLIAGKSNKDLINKMHISQSVVFSVNVCFIIYVIIVFLFFVLYGIPLLYDDIYTARRAVQVLPGVFLFYKVMLIMGPMLSVVYLLIFNDSGKKSSKKNYIFVVFVNVLVNFLLGFKAYVAWFVILQLIAFSLYSNNNKKTIVAIISAIILSIISTMIMYNLNFFESILKFIYRATVEGGYGLKILVNEFMAIESSSKYYFSLAEELTRWKYGSTSMLVKSDLSLTITSVGAFYYYWGWLGLLLGSFFYGYIGRILEKKSKMNSSIFVRTFYIYILYVMVTFTNRGYIFNLIYESLFYGAFFIVFIILFFFVINYSKRKNNFT